MTTYITHVAADTANGVYKVDPVDYPDADWLPFEFFFTSLSDVEDGEVLYCAVDPDQLALLEGDYSVTLA
jgi:hypothetical protein